ncbi:unnamed protein product [Fraxinus pennsylvanica]|uniref:Uncharacterized protein n=1 Tax=Fraxinus pennsylvanica TaxID=56036 RepID=A0AAD2ABB8_9LAMI|nr:unnamed protein product [Fraxinus pennsylvanica]
MKKSDPHYDVLEVSPWIAVGDLTVIALIKALGVLRRITKGDKMAKMSSFANMVRRRLSDITNSLPNPKSPAFVEKLPSDTASGKDYIDHFVKIICYAFFCIHHVY